MTEFCGFSYKYYYGFNWCIVLCILILLVTSFPNFLHSSFFPSLVSLVLQWKKRWVLATFAVASNNRTEKALTFCSGYCLRSMCWWETKEWRGAGWKGTWPHRSIGWGHQILNSFPLELQSLVILSACVNAQTSALFVVLIGLLMPHRYVQLSQKLMSDQ